MVLDEAFRPRDHHRAHSFGALDVRVVIDFDALRHVIQLEKFGHFAQGFRLGAAFRQPPVERFTGIAAGLLHQFAPVAALRDRKANFLARQL